MAVFDGQKFGIVKSVYGSIKMLNNEKMQGIWIFEDPNEFLKVMEDMQKAYNQKGVGNDDQ